MTLYTRYYRKMVIDHRGYKRFVDMIAYILTDNITPWNYGLNIKFKPEDDPEAWDFTDIIPDKMYEEEL